MQDIINTFLCANTSIFSSFETNEMNVWRYAYWRTKKVKHKNQQPNLTTTCSKEEDLFDDTISARWIWWQASKNMQLQRTLHTSYRSTFYRHCVTKRTNNTTATALLHFSSTEPRKDDLLFDCYCLIVFIIIVD